MWQSNSAFHNNYHEYISCTVNMINNYEFSIILLQYQNECTKVQNLLYKDVTLCLLYSIVLYCVSITLCTHHKKQVNLLYLSYNVKQQPLLQIT